MYIARTNVFMENKHDLKNIYIYIKQHYNIIVIRYHNQLKHD